MPGEEEKKKKAAAAAEPDRVLICGRPDFARCDNQVRTARYTLVTFLPVVSAC
jgi:hypothetical protein